MDWYHPPRSYEELCIWRVYVATSGVDVWSCIHRWIKKYGNPFITPDNETEQAFDERQMFRRALEASYM